MPAMAPPRTIAPTRSSHSDCTPLSLQARVLHVRVVGFDQDGPERRTGVRRGVRLAAGHGGLAGGAMQPPEDHPHTPVSSDHGRTDKIRSHHFNV